MLDRRVFLKNATKTVVLSGLMGQSILKAESLDAFEKVTILHTNDTHSRIDPFDSGDFAGLGGVIARKAIIDEIRKTEKHVLLLDAGDIFQGTPYFNLYNGELEIKAMSMLGYDAATMGNHDFDGGIDNFEKQLNHANFPFIVSNYNFENTPLDQKIQKYKIFQKGNIRIGVFGLGIELDGLVPKALYGETQYLDPIHIGNQYAHFLKHEKKCQIIIGLSHLGYSYPNKQRVSDLLLAESIDNVDVIIGGHTHTFLNSPKEIKNKFGKFVIVNQVGWGGINLGRLDVYLKKDSKKVDKNESMLIKCQ
jgi:5'-nucleotidase